MKKSGVSETPLAPASAGSAMTSFQQGDCRESIRHFTAALQQQEHPALFNGLGMAYLSCNQPQAAAKAFERAVALAPGSAALHTNLGTALYDAADSSGAEKQFEAALRIDPANPEAIVGKSSILIQQKHPEKALKLLSQLAGVEGAAPEVLYNRALAMYEMGLADDAANALGTYAREHPDDAEAQNALGVIELRLKKYASAKARFDRAISLRPDQGSYYYNRANALKEQKAFREAVEDYSRAIAFLPELAGAYVNRGDVRFLLRETEGACEDLRKACDLGACDRLETYEEAGRCRTGVWK